jgi:type VI protein secretion system component VasF
MRLMQRIFSTHPDQDHHQSAQRALRRLRIAIFVWVILLAATLLWFAFFP